MKIYKVTYWNLLKILHLLVFHISWLHDWMHIEYLICVLGAYGVNTEPSRCKMGEYRGCICCLEKFVNVFQYVCLWKYQLIIWKSDGCKNKLVGIVGYHLLCVKRYFWASMIKFWKHIKCLKMIENHCNHCHIDEFWTNGWNMVCSIFAV